jgi:hypothetical protein
MYKIFSVVGINYFLNPGEAFHGSGGIPADLPLCGQFQPGQEGGKLHHYSRSVHTSFFFFYIFLAG